MYLYTKITSPLHISPPSSRINCNPSNINQNELIFANVSFKLVSYNSYTLIYNARFLVHKWVFLAVKRVYIFTILLLLLVLLLIFCSLLIDRLKRKIKRKRKYFDWWWSRKARIECRDCSSAIIMYPVYTLKLIWLWSVQQIIILWFCNAYCCQLFERHPYN